jgi:hypothetical protein
MFVHKSIQKVMLVPIICPSVKNNHDGVARSKISPSHHILNMQKGMLIINLPFMDVFADAGTHLEIRVSWFV